MDPERCELLCLDLPKAEAVRSRLLGPGRLREAAALARALADPTRLSLAVALGEADELCVCDLAWIAGRSDKLVSHHLRVLRQAGLAEFRRDGKVALYRLTETGRRMVDAMLLEAVR
jgi:ArsR family transcriptional regulator, lead/cadmium/zinc/bismuth-responsive transcriptional repressor